MVKGSNVSILKTGVRLRSAERFIPRRQSYLTHTPHIPLIINGIDLAPHSLDPYQPGYPLRERQISQSVASLTTLESAQRLQRARVDQDNKVESSQVTLNVSLKESVRSILVNAAKSHSEQSFCGQLPQLVDEDNASELGFTGESFDRFTTTTEACPTIEEIPNKVRIILNETNTIFLLDIPSKTELKNTEGGEDAIQANERYEYITKGRGRFRKQFDVGIQTVPIYLKDRDTKTEFIHKYPETSYISNYTYYETYHQSTEEKKDKNGHQNNQNQFNNDTTKFGILDDDDYSEETSSFSIFHPSRVSMIHGSVSSLDAEKQEEKQMLDLIRNPKFQNALIVLERLLARYEFGVRQKQYRGGFFDDDEDSNVNGNLSSMSQLDTELLWTYFTEGVKSMMVSTMMFVPGHQNLLAVGYKFIHQAGEFKMKQSYLGCVSIWNAKNPVRPERFYTFKTEMVSAIAFCDHCPTYLAIGFYEGRVIIIDISSRDLKIIGEDFTRFDTVWSIVWFRSNHGSLNLMVAFDDGRVFKYSLRFLPTLMGVQMMRTMKSEGSIKGIGTLRKCAEEQTELSQRFIPAKVLALMPGVKHCYLIGSADGVIHQCSINYFDQQIDQWQAHEGAIRTIAYSDFANKVYITCGDDCMIRIWADGVYVPLIETKAMTPIADVCWSPSHSTIFISVREDKLYLWDGASKFYEPKNSASAQSACTFLLCKFTSDGRSIAVADDCGAVHVYRVKNPPKAAFFQMDQLQRVIRTAVQSHADLYEQLIKCEPLKHKEKK